MSLNPRRVREERERFERGERQELEQRLAPIKAEVSKSMQRADAMTRSYFSQDLRHIADCFASEIFTADLGAQYPSTDEKQGGTRGRAEYEEFVANLPQSGFLLSASGCQRLLIFCLNQAFSENHADLANPETYRIAFDRLYQLDCFDLARAELGFDESIRVVEPVVEQPAPELGVDDLENIAVTSKDGERIAHAVISREVFDGEAKTVFRQFVSHVSKTFGHDLTPDEQREIILYFTKNNKSFLDHRAYDQCRVNLVRRGILNHGCLTEDEVLCQELEDDSDQSYEGRRNRMQQIVAARRR